MTGKKQRLDRLLVQRGMAGSGEQARRLIRAGQVRVAGQVHDKPGHLFATDVELTVAQPERFVGRGGHKLEAALDFFDLQVAGCDALDVGSSTGGFTDCLLQHGARHVTALDVGRGQLHWKLRNDPRVSVREGVNARKLKPEMLPSIPDLAVIDVSFISLTLVLPAVKDVLAKDSRLVTLIKPQFEARRKDIARGGVVRDKDVHRQVVESIMNFGTRDAGLKWMGSCPSPLRGPAGNIEFLAYWKKE